MKPLSSFVPAPAFGLAFFVALLACNSNGHGLCTAQDKTKLSAAEAEKSPSPAALFEPREYGGEDGKVLRYRLLKPLDFDPTEKYPLVIFLHGAGERGDDNVAQLKHGMKDFCDPSRREKYRCYVLAPQCPKNARWADIDWSKKEMHIPAETSDSMKLVFEVVDRMVADAAIDKNRIYVTGLSMGGYGTWDCLYRRPDFFAAALPICGGVSTEVAESIKHVPVWCFHGADDKVVTVDYSRDMIASLKAAGGTPKYTEYPGVGHDSWSTTYANPQIYEWLFSQRRTRQSR